MITITIYISRYVSDYFQNEEYGWGAKAKNIDIYCIPILTIKYHIKISVKVQKFLAVNLKNLIDYNLHNFEDLIK